jgi:CheY-like chemotaxis protein
VAANRWSYGDSARLQQVFWNLVRNAVKFTPAGGRLEVRTEDAGDRVRIDFIDSGIGIAPDVLPKIFERFEQGGAATTKQFGGLGLGLSICRAIVELHRGVIRAESRGRGWGSTFTIVLPAKSEAPLAVPISQTQVLRVSGKLPRRVLLVDDHEDTRETLARLLARAGYQVTGADSVQSALEKAASERFDILVSDLGLPDGHGTELMREVKARYNLPGIAFSGFGMQDDVEKSLEAGFSAHLTKPVDFKQLKEAMSEALSNTPRVAAVER